MSLRRLRLRPLRIETKYNAHNANDRRAMSSKPLGNVMHSSISNPLYSLDEKYGTNGGSIEGVWIFHRHGDRTPTCPLCAEHLMEDDASFWRTKLPDVTAVREVANRFPKRIHSTSVQDYLDGKREPYGFLTRVGTSQMYNTGRRFALRYSRLGRKDRSLTVGNSETGDLLKDWDITAYSTNYLRTITSAQFFLDGLLNSSPKSSKESKKQSTGNKSDITSSLAEAGIHINVRDRDLDSLNAFDKNPKKMLSLVKEVVSTPDFQMQDSLAVPLASLLANFLPGLASGNTQLFGGPSGINWIHANDHFICRTSHGMKLTAIEPENENQEVHKSIKNANSFWDPGLEESMQALAHPTMAHLAWRFRQWFTYPPLMGAIAAPPLREVERDLRETVTLGAQEKRPLKVFSCHDVTILSILYGLNASDIIENERYWPPYATTLVFELVKVTERDEYLVRVLLNGKPVKVKMLDNKLMNLDVFTQIVNDVEEAGGIGDDEEETDSMERDMSNWTG